MDSGVHCTVDSDGTELVEVDSACTKLVYSAGTELVDSG